MTEGRYWEIIEESRATLNPRIAEGNLQRQGEALEALLAALPADDVLAFVKGSKKRMIEAYRWDVWAAAYILRGGCSDDSFSDFRCWLISMGPTVFKRVLAEVESLAEIWKRFDVEDTGFEDFDYIPRKVYLAKTGLGIPDFGMVMPDEPAGKAWPEDDDALQQRFPKIWASRYG